jgi:CheY-like chemotaxis protein
VDDDKSILHTLKSLLLKSGYEVITAPNGEEALQLLKNANPDLIISDLVMPMMNGWYFKMKVRNDERFKTTPIIILSAMVAQEGGGDYGVGGGDYKETATYYLAKPFNASALMDKIKELISGRTP